VAERIDWKARALAAESELARVRARPTAGKPPKAPTSEDGVLVARARVELGMSGNELAAALEIDAAQLSRARRGTLPVAARARLVGMLAERAAGGSRASSGGGRAKTGFDKFVDEQLRKPGAQDAYLDARAEVGAFDVARRLERGTKKGGA
jgi:hypothetical protein